MRLINFADYIVEGKEIRDQIKLEYQIEEWSKPTQLDLNEIPIDDGFSWFKVQALDLNLVLYLDANNFVEYSAVGDIELIKDQGTVHRSQKVGLSNGVVRIKATRFGKSYSLTVKSSGLDTVVLAGMKTKQKINN